MWLNWPGSKLCSRVEIRAAAAPPLFLRICLFFLSFFLLQPPLMIATSPAICLLFKTVQRKQDVQKERVTHWTYKALLDQVATILCSPNKRYQIPAWAQCVQTAVKVAEPPQGSSKFLVVAGGQKTRGLKQSCCLLQTRCLSFVPVSSREECCVLMQAALLIPCKVEEFSIQ